MVRRISSVVIAGTVFFCLFQSATAQPPGQEERNAEQRALNAETRITVADLERRLAEIEKANLATRSSLLESDMSEIKWIARGAATAIVGQILFMAFAKPPIRRRRSSDKEDDVEQEVA